MPQDNKFQVKELTNETDIETPIEPYVILEDSSNIHSNNLFQEKENEDRKKTLKERIFGDNEELFNMAERVRTEEIDYYDFNKDELSWNDYAKALFIDIFLGDGRLAKEIFFGESLED